MDVRNIVASKYMDSSESTFQAYFPASGSSGAELFQAASVQHVDDALRAATAAASTVKTLSKDKKAEFLRAIAQEIAALGDVLIERAMLESGLPQARLLGERGRTIAQLNLFADHVAEGSWVEAIIDPALPDRQPAPRPDMRRMLVPIGPVAIFGASNFPLAFSVAGGDTASALAAGCPVIVKAHPAHPGTSALVASAIMKAVVTCDLPAGIFSMLYGPGNAIGEALVKHPALKAVAFTGSSSGGKALCKIAMERAQPIPVFAEMGSVNPVLLLPEALEERAEALAAEYATSITMGVGQFCTNPGLLLAIDSPSLKIFKKRLAELMSDTPSATMLNEGIFRNFNNLSRELLNHKELQLLAQSDKLDHDQVNQGLATLAEVSGEDFLKNPQFTEEVFGPWSMLVVVKSIDEMTRVLKEVGGQLTVSVMTGAEIPADYLPLLQAAEDVAGRVLMNGVPTGVEVSHAMQHGGPFPATSDSRFTSVGATAIRRFARPVCWQNWQQHLLPDELKDNNPLRIWRLNNKQWTKE